MAVTSLCTVWISQSTKTAPSASPMPSRCVLCFFKLPYLPCKAFPLLNVDVGTQLLLRKWMIVISKAEMFRLTMRRLF